MRKCTIATCYTLATIELKLSDRLGQSLPYCAFAAIIRTSVDCTYSARPLYGRDDVDVHYYVSITPSQMSEKY